MQQGERLYECLVATYEALKENASDLGNGEYLYEGSLSELMKKYEIKNQHSIILTKLENMDCITRMQRGNAYQPSKVALHRDPTWPEFQASGPTYGGKNRKSSMQQRIEDVVRRQNDLEDRMDRLEYYYETQTGTDQ